MALAERTSEDSVELPTPPQGHEADTRYQKILQLADSMGESMILHLIETLKDRIQAVK